MLIKMRQNRLLSLVPPEELEKLLADMRTVTLRRGQKLRALAGSPAVHVFFPTTAVIAHVMLMNNGDAIETMSVGREGMYGASALLGHSIGDIESYVQTGGEALRLLPERFCEHAQLLPTFRALIYRFIGSQVAMLTQQLCCNALHPAVQRGATRLLLTADRSSSESFDMTHDKLATILGGHRPAATVVAAALARSGRIRYRHGKVEILNRPALIDDACECYGVIAAASESVFAA